MSQNALSKSDLVSEVTAIDNATMQTEMASDLIQEYNCQTPSEISLANITSISYIHYLDLQKQIDDCETRLSALYYSHDSCMVNDFHPYIPNNGCKRSQFELLRLSALSKEADRAYRRYIASLNMMIRIRQSPIQINIKTQTTILGQNQLIQNNNHG